jgi:hypothetical protein
MRKPVLFLRVAAVLTFLHAVLHTIGGVFGKVGPGPRHHCRRGDEDKSVSADGTDAKLLGFLSGARAGGPRYPLRPRRFCSGSWARWQRQTRGGCGRFWLRFWLRIPCWR